MTVKKIFFLVFFTLLFVGCDKDEPQTGQLELLHVFAGNTEINLNGSVTDNIPVDRTISLIFSKPLNPASTVNATTLKHDGQIVENEITLSSGGTTIVIFPTHLLENNATYSIELSNQLMGSKGESFLSTEISFKTIIGALTLVSIEIDGNIIDLNATTRLTNVPLSLPITLNFSVPLNETSVGDAIDVTGPGSPSPQFYLSNEDKTVTLSTVIPLNHLSKYQLKISNILKGVGGENYAGLSKIFYTTLDETPKYPIISDEELLSKVQQQTFKYFWDFAEPVSGMALERNTSGNLVTSGGSGFGIMAVIVGIERNFITRTQGLERMDKILDFLETSDRFHGAWSHWIDGTNGNVIPFSPNDNGGDLVETSYLIQGLLTFRQYLDGSIPAELALINRINALWESVEWDWYRQDNQDVLYWHWSPTVDWSMNHQIKGWNECLITYVLSASSPTHNIPKVVYDKGWASDGGMANGKTFEGITLPLGPDYGGPLFFSQYSFLGLDPINLNDTYANYWEQNVSHSEINYKYCVQNPGDFVGYSEDCWGLTASDNSNGYSAHSPTNDLGVITPTAALSSFPYTPDQSMKALKFFYYILGDRLWGEYGFYDAFNVTEGWTADSYLAIDQGPIIIMIENYRSGLLWDLFMSAPEVQQGLNELSINAN